MSARAYPGVGEGSQGPLHVDRRRILRGGAIAAWAAFFTWLWVSGEMYVYVGPRTGWVIPFGTVVLSGTAVAYLKDVLTREPQTTPGVNEVVGTALLLVPLVVALAVPDPELGSLAAGRKSNRADPSAIEVDTSGDFEPIKNPSLRDISYAEFSPRFSRVTGVGEGSAVKLMGFVDDTGAGPEGTFELTRFRITCCAADAMPFSVAVDPGASGSPDLSTDDWVEVSGTLEERGRRLVLEADTLRPTSEPKDPYFY